MENRQTKFCHRNETHGKNDAKEPVVPGLSEIQRHPKISQTGWIQIIENIAGGNTGSACLAKQKNRSLEKLPTMIVRPGREVNSFVKTLRFQRCIPESVKVHLKKSKKASEKAQACMEPSNTPEVFFPGGNSAYVCEITKVSRKGSVISFRLGRLVNATSIVLESKFKSMLIQMIQDAMNTENDERKNVICADGIDRTVVDGGGLAQSRSINDVSHYGDYFMLQLNKRINAKSFNVPINQITEFGTLLEGSIA